MNKNTRKVLRALLACIEAIIVAFIANYYGYLQSSREYQQQIEEEHNQKTFFMETNEELNYRINQLQNELALLKEQMPDPSDPDSDPSTTFETLVDENARLKDNYEELLERFELLSKEVERLSANKKNWISLKETDYDGHVTISEKYAAEGEKISVKLEPASGFRVICTDSIGNTIMCEWDAGVWCFIMPPNDVTIEVSLLP